MGDFPEELQFTHDVEDAFDPQAGADRRNGLSGEHADEVIIPPTAGDAPDAGSFHGRYETYPANVISYNEADNTYSVDENNDAASVYTFDNPDYNFRQFRSNLVIRWEYLPGSTLFLVWSQGRTSSATNGIYSYGRDMKDLFTVQPHNVFLIKLSYWLPL